MWRESNHCVDRVVISLEAYLIQAVPILLKERAKEFPFSKWQQMPKIVFELFSCYSCYFSIEGIIA